MVVAISLLIAGSSLALALWAIPRGTGPVISSGSRRAVDDGLLEATCTKPGETSLESKEVHPTAQGVSLAVSAEYADAVFHVTLGEHREGPYDTFTFVVDAAPTVVTLPIPPGQALVGCFVAPFSAETVARETLVPVEIVDDAGEWITPQLACEQPMEFRYRLAEPLPSTATASDVVQAAVAWVDSGDVLEPAGYPADARSSLIVIYRSGIAIAQATVTLRDGVVQSLLPVDGVMCPGAENGWGAENG